MIIYPAVDIKNGVCVRLKRGDMSMATRYGKPYELAVKWESAGARYLHVVDLDAAFSGTFSNFNAVKAIMAHVSIPVQLGGGIRSMADIDVRLKELNISRVILGTAAYEDPDLVKKALGKYSPEKIAVGIDAKDGKVAIKGWAEGTDADPVSLALNMKALGVTTIVYTDIARDGMLTGPNIAMTREMVEKTGMDIIASGGMNDTGDIRKVEGTGAAGVIIGKALYSGNIDLAEAVRIGE